MSTAPFELLSWLGIDRTSSASLEYQLTQQLTRFIASGRLRSGDRLPPLQTLADHVGVNLHTARAAYQQLQANGLVDARPGRGTTVLDTSVSDLAAGRTKGRTYTIGVILPAFAAFYAEVFEGMRAASSDDPSQLLISHCREDPATAHRYLRQFVAMGVDGLVMISQQLPPGGTFERSGTPPVVYGDWPGSPKPSITFSTGAVSDAIDHLVDHGHERIAIISPPPSLLNMAALLDAYTSGLQANGMAANADWVVEVPDFSPAAASVALSELAELTTPPTAVITASETLALGVYSEARRRLMSIPDDLAVIAYGGTEFAGALEPQLATVTLPAREMGERLMTTLLDLINGTEPEEQATSLTSRLDPRASCGCAAARDIPEDQPRAG